MAATARPWLGLALLAQATILAAQDTGPVHDAPYIPSPQYVVDEMLRLAGVGPQDLVYDLGSGDGRVLIAAATKFGARAVGVERDPALVVRSRAGAERAGLAGRVRVLQQDLFATDLAEATVVTLYLSPSMNLRLRPALLRLRPGTRIVSHSSDMGDWKPDRRTSIRKDVLLWRVPAQVAGRWRSDHGPGKRRLEIEFMQRYQEVTANARFDGTPVEIWQARLEADRLSFVLIEDPHRQDETSLYFEGRVSGNTVEGTVSRGVGRAAGVDSWRAERAGR